MHILFTRFPLESAYGGAEVQTLSLMRGLRARGHAVTFVGSCPVIGGHGKEKGIACTALEIGPPPVTKWGAVSFIWRAPLMRRKLTSVLGQFADARAIFMLSLSEKLLATEWAVSRGLRVFWIEHDHVGPWLGQNPWLPRLRRLSRQAVTVVVSDLSRDTYVRLGWRPEDIRVIPNGIDLRRFEKTEPNTDRPAALRIGCVARLSEEKGVDLLVQAVLDLPGVSLDIIGVGWQEEFLRSIIDKAGAAKRIRLLPTTRDLGAFYASLDLCVLPSREHDPFGLVAAEAMGMGLATVVTDACGIALSLRDGVDALVVPANDAAALRAAIDRLRDPVFRRALGEAGAKTAKEKFSLETMVDQYEALLP